jgi:hypothetical protein
MTDGGKLPAVHCLRISFELEQQTGNIKVADARRAMQWSA